MLQITHHGIEIQRGVSIASRVNISCTDGGTISFGEGLQISEEVQIICRAGRLRFGKNVFLGKGSVVVCTNELSVEQDTLIAEYVVVRDQDHDTARRPIYAAGFRTSPIKIGRDCWLGAKVTVLRGSTIGDGAVIGAHSLVRGEIPPYTLAAGSPAKVIKKLARP